VVWTDTDRTEERARFSFPRQNIEPWLCISDYFKPIHGDEVDVVAFHIVSMGAAISKRTAELFAQDRYEHYLKLHGIGVEMTEALAEYWHARVRGELGINTADDTRSVSTEVPGWKIFMGLPGVSGSRRQSHGCEPARS